MSLTILDTDHFSLYMRGHASLSERIRSIPAEQIAITIISAEELLRGRLAQVHRATTGQQRIIAYRWLAETIDFLHDFQILHFDDAAQAKFSTISALRNRIGSQDLRIAAIVLAQSATLATRNKRDFEQIPSVRLEDWAN